MYELKGKELQEYLLAILIRIDEFCKKNSITYFLSGGTLLGAVRHKGFIPWDDDIDIMMPRKDYDYLVNHFQDERYILSSCWKDEHCDSPFARIWDSYTQIGWKSQRQIIGVYVDIFPIDGYPDSRRLSRLREYLIMNNRKRLLIVLANPKTFKGKLAFLKKMIQPLLGNANRLCKKMDCFAKKYDYETSEYVGVQIGTHNTYKERNPKSVYQETVFLEFEGNMLPAPIGYDDYLSHLFGDYMTMPPEEKRCSEHKTPFYCMNAIDKK